MGEYQNCKQKQLVKINQNQFDSLKLVQGNYPRIKLKLNFNFCVNRFFLYFQNFNDKSIYFNNHIQLFEKIVFVIEGYEVLEFDYTDLIISNSKDVLGYELPPGVFEIKWNMYEYKNLSYVDRFELDVYSLLIPLNIGIGFCASNVNLLGYESNCCRLVFLN